MKKSKSFVLLRYKKGGGAPFSFFSFFLFFFPFFFFFQKSFKRSGVGADAIHPAFWGSFAQHTPRHDIGCPTLCKVIISADKATPPNGFFDSIP